MFRRSVPQQFRVELMKPAKLKDVKSLKPKLVVHKTNISLLCCLQSVVSSPALRVPPVPPEPSEFDIINCKVQHSPSQVGRHQAKPSLPLATERRTKSTVPTFCVMAMGCVSSVERREV